MTTEQGRLRTLAARRARTQAKHDRWVEELREAGYVCGERPGEVGEGVVIMLRNLEWLLTNRDAALDMDQSIVRFNGGGVSVNVLLTPGMTSATATREG